MSQDIRLYHTRSKGFPRMIYFINKLYTYMKGYVYIYVIYTLHICII